MTALAAPNTNSQSRVDPSTQRIDKYVVKTGETIYQGSQTGFDTNGFLVATGYAFVLGRALQTIVAAVAGATIEVEEGILTWTNAGSGPVVAASKGKVCYSADNQTVTVTASTNPPAGYVYDIDPNGQVWVLSTMAVGAALVGIAAAALTP